MSDFISALKTSEFIHPYGQCVNTFEFKHQFKCIDDLTRIDIESKSHGMTAIYFYDFNDQTIIFSSRTFNGGVQLKGEAYQLNAEELSFLTHTTQNYMAHITKLVNAKTKEMRTDYGRSFKRDVLETGVYRDYFSNMNPIALKAFEPKKQAA